MHIEQSTSDILLFEYLSSSHQHQPTQITPSTMVSNMSPQRFLNPHTIINHNSNNSTRSPNTQETTSTITGSASGNPSIQLSLPPISAMPPFNIQMNRMQMAQQAQNGPTSATTQQQMSQCTLHSPHSGANMNHTINGQQVVAARNVNAVNGNVSNVSYQNHTQTQSQMQSIPIPPIPLNTMNMNSMNMKPVNFINTNEASHTSQSTLPLKAVVATHAHTTQPQQPQTQTVIIPACNGVANGTGTLQTRPVYYATTTGNIAQAPTQTLPAGSYQIVSSQNTANTTNVTNVSSHQQMQQMHHQTQNIQNMGIQQQVHVLNTNTINNTTMGSQQHHVNHVNVNNNTQFVHTTPTTQLLTYHHSNNNIYNHSNNNNARYIIHQSGPNQIQNNNYVQTYKML